MTNSMYSKSTLIARISVFIDSAETDEKAKTFPITTLLRDIREYLRSSEEQSAQNESD